MLNESESISVAEAVNVTRFWSSEVIESDDFVTLIEQFFREVWAEEAWASSDENFHDVVVLGDAFAETWGIEADFTEFIDV